MNKKFVQIFLIFILLLAFFEMPYGYYEFLRVVGTTAFIYLAYVEYKSKVQIIPIIFLICAIVLNPLFIISFKKDTWQIIDLGFAILLLASLLFEKYIYKYLKNG